VDYAGLGQKNPVLDGQCVLAKLSIEDFDAGDGPRKSKDGVGAGISGFGCPA